MMDRVYTDLFVVPRPRATWSSLVALMCLSSAIVSCVDITRRKLTEPNGDDNPPCTNLFFLLLLLHLLFLISSPLLLLLLLPSLPFVLDPPSRLFLLFPMH